MNGHSILAEFTRRGITLRAEGGRLIAKPLSSVPPELLKLRANTKPNCSPCLPATVALNRPTRSVPRFRPYSWPLPTRLQAPREARFSMT